MCTHIILNQITLPLWSSAIKKLNINCVPHPRKHNLKCALKEYLSFFKFSRESLLGEKNKISEKVIHMKNVPEETITQ